jgi:hypothetical protein
MSRESSVGIATGGWIWPLTSISCRGQEWWSYTPPYVCMAWCSINWAQRQTLLYLTFTGRRFPWVRTRGALQIRWGQSAGNRINSPVMQPTALSLYWLSPHTYIHIYTKCFQFRYEVIANIVQFESMFWLHDKQDNVNTRETRRAHYRWHYIQFGTRNQFMCTISADCIIFIIWNLKICIVVMFIILNA